jgi:hypothetical protein
VRQVAAQKGADAATMPRTPGIGEHVASDQAEDQALLVFEGCESSQKERGDNTGVQRGEDSRKDDKACNARVEPSKAAVGCVDEIDDRLGARLNPDQKDDAYDYDGSGEELSHDSSG